MHHRLLALAVATALLLAACGGDDPAADDMAGMDDTSGMDMVMNEPDSTRADELTDVEQLRSSPIALFEDAPERFDGVTGQVWAAFDGGTTVTLDLTGLPAGEEIVAHLHAEPCEVRGGPHFQFEEGGSEVPPNEVHLAGTPDEDGTLELTVTNDDDATAAQSLIFHPRADTDTYVGCADLREATTTVG